MPRFRKKPVEIEAIRWNGFSNRIGLTNGKEGSAERYEYPSWMPPVSKAVEEQDEALTVPAGSIYRLGEQLWIGTLKGPHRADPGDWIICGTKGELYPCKPDIFADIYDEVLLDA